MTESELVLGLRCRDEETMRQFLTKYGPLMRYVMGPILPDPREREECISDVAMKLWDRIGSFDPQKGSFTTWLTVLTRNAALNRAKSAPPAHQELTPDIPAPDSDPELRLLKKERQAALLGAISQLSDQEAALLYRKYFYRQSTAQIARETGLSERAVEGKLYRSKQKLRRILGGDDHG